MTWPMYSKACRKDVDELLRAGGSLSAYRANPQVGVEPREGSWAWRMERDVERRFRVKHAVAVNSGTAALHAALSTLNLRPDDEVITSPYTFSATASAIILAGGRPVFADVGYTYNITPETVKRAITKNTKAILPVSLFGGMADVRGLQTLGFPVIEDACQAVGARDSRGYAGTQGLAGCYSFNGGKNVPAGEAGCLVTNSDSVAEKARLLMNHGENFGDREVGLNYRLTEITACIAWHGLQDLKARNERRSKLAHDVMNSDAFDDERLGRPMCCELGEEDHVFYVFPFEYIGKSREAFCRRMEKRGIPVGRGYIQPTLPHYKAFRKYARGPLPVVEELSRKTLCILSTLTPDRPLYYAKTVAKAMRESLS